MAFHEISLTAILSYGTTFGPRFNTSVIELDSGGEQRVRRWSGAGKRMGDVSYAIKSREQLAAMTAFFIARGGAANGFRFKDSLDFSSNADHIGATTNADQLLGSGNGTKQLFQLVKRYTDDSGTTIRNITKPISGTVKIALDGVNQSSGWTVDTTTGIVTFTSAPGNGVSVTAGFEFEVPVRFDKSIDLNALQAALDDYGHGHVESLPIIELADGLEVNEDSYCGAAVEVCLRTSYLLSAGYAKFYVFETTVAGLSVMLPDFTNVPPGGPMFHLVNIGPESFTLKTFAGATVKTLAVDQGAILGLTVDGAGAKSWYVL
jgi:uncharacterized protein (TIGR02217 family)